MLSVDAWSYIFTNFCTAADLRAAYDTCRTMRNVVRSNKVGKLFMDAEGLDFVANESWIKTFSNRRICLALDLSPSMIVGAEGWRYSIALQEVKKMVQKFRHFAALKGIDLLRFAENVHFVKVRSLEEMDENLIDINIRVGETSYWDQFAERVSHYLTGVSNSRFYVFSDLEMGSPEGFLERITSTPFNSGSSLHLCCVGNSPIGVALIKRIKNTHEGVEPAAKKSKSENEIFTSHISSESGEEVEYTLTTAPTVIFEEGY